MVNAGVMGRTTWKKTDTKLNCSVESANKEHEIYPSHTYFLINLRTYDPMPMHHVGSRSYEVETLHFLKITTRWQWMVGWSSERCTTRWYCALFLLYSGFEYFILFKSTGYVMHQQFNIQQLYVLPTLYLCVSYLSENKQRLVALTA